MVFVSKLENISLSLQNMKNKQMLSSACIYFFLYEKIFILPTPSGGVRQMTKYKHLDFIYLLQFSSKY